QAAREHDGADADREVDEEDPVPVDRLGQRTTDEQPNGAAGRRDEREHADRLRLRPWSLNIVTIIPRITEEVIAPPAPWANRAATSMPWLEASPQTVEAAVKTVRPHRNIRRRPI